MKKTAKDERDWKAAGRKANRERAEKRKTRKTKR